MPENSSKSPKFELGFRGKYRRRGEPQPERESTLEELLMESSDEGEGDDTDWGMNSVMNTSFAKGAAFDNDSSRTHKEKRHSLKIDMDTLKELPELQTVVKYERMKEWVSSFRRSDPRFRIMEYFDTAATLGIDYVVQKGDVKTHSISPLLRMFAKSACFTVWRPTSKEAIRKMILGLGVGKGLDVKGKSAKRGRLSGYVPFLQIHEDEHKNKIYQLPKSGPNIRIFFKTSKQRHDAARYVCKIAQEMLETVQLSKQILRGNKLRLGGLNRVKADSEEDQTIKQKALELITKWEMVDPEVAILDNYASCTKPVFGISIPERVFWEAFVVRKDIKRDSSDHETGRPSVPAFQDMNFCSLRQGVADYSKPRPCIYQFNTEDALEGRDLVVAYEEGGRVVPVVSDFDCFLVGTRQVSYSDPIPPEQVALVQKQLNSVEKILSETNAENVSSSWTDRWLDMLKKENAPKPAMPPYGYGDPKSTALIKLAVERLNRDGSVRHGAECFNYIFPQELDDIFLVIGKDDDDPTGLPWRYVNQKGLLEILKERVRQGFAFPLNPKWILCDQGWKSVYDELLKSDVPRVQASLECWYPKDSGIRERIEEIYHKYPNGFGSGKRHSMDGATAMDLAEFQLDHHLQLRRAKAKIKAIIAFMRFAKGSADLETPLQLDSDVRSDLDEEDEEEPPTLTVRTSSHARQATQTAAEQAVVDVCRESMNSKSNLNYEWNKQDDEYDNTKKNLPDEEKSARLSELDNNPLIQLAVDMEGKLKKEASPSACMAKEEKENEAVVEGENWAEEDEKGEKEENGKMDSLVFKRKNASLRNIRVEEDEKSEEERNDKIDSGSNRQEILEPDEALRVTNDENDVMVGSDCVDPETSSEDSADDEQLEEGSLDENGKLDKEAFDGSFSSLRIRPGSCRRFSEEQLAQALSTEFSPNSSKHRKRVAVDYNNHEENLLSDDIQRGGEDKMDVTLGGDHVVNGNKHEENLASDDVQRGSDNKIDVTPGVNHVDSSFDKSVDGENAENGDNDEESEDSLSSDEDLLEMPRLRIKTSSQNRQTEKEVVKVLSNQFTDILAEPSTDTIKKPEALEDIIFEPTATPRHRLPESMNNGKKSFVQSFRKLAPRKKSDRELRDSNKSRNSDSSKKKFKLPGKIFRGLRRKKTTDTL
mmetsp:Transcript_10670/g.16339  ORF Transcript_10670/g.16339 Transcript_10670/m.16339 type:complete len:1161 (+) Transcript_10670:266-3748(+)|eukprot:CAMPEP_0178899516 /NCGR_PEP_ID=MMETSP0786-20121207/2944_1 /TAXON_ID=186022 /ORGANISM="Thalassionema frauenfeldii, Strain CCMP 1798" /LENGTH=1160 /DNA_ID=CAMNT_0020570383 /DNA_START=185 /DNA_END=3667 /DNA_ORIENTATION=+